MSLARAFWIVACSSLVPTVALVAKLTLAPQHRYDYLSAAVFAVFVCCLAAIMAIVAVIRNRMAYRIGLALVLVPPLCLGAQYAAYAIDLATSPSAEALQAGHGYFSASADRALADAIVAGDATKVASLPPAANTNTVGRTGMTFMRLALEAARADPAVVAALLRAGINPDLDHQMLFGSINDGAEADSGAMITGKNERLLRAVIDAGVDLNHHDLEGNPRFFSAVRWPEGLALMLEHGANTEAEDQQGNTAIMVAVMLWYWPSIDVLLAHGAQIDRVNHDGKSLRDLVLEKLERYRRDQRDAPSQLSALEARLR